MRSSGCGLLLALLFGSISTVKAENPAFHDLSKPFKTTVDILALRSSVLHGYAGGQQTFIARIRIEGKERLAVLIDRFRVADYPIRYSILSSRQILTMKLQRDESCDELASLIYLPLGDHYLFDPGLGKKLEQEGSTPLACFVVDHQQTRLAR